MLKRYESLLWYSYARDTYTPMRCVYPTGRERPEYLLEGTRMVIGRPRKNLAWRHHQWYETGTRWYDYGVAASTPCFRACRFSSIWQLRRLGRLGGRLGASLANRHGPTDVQLLMLDCTVGINSGLRSPYGSWQFPKFLCAPVRCCSEVCTSADNHMT